MWHDTYSQVIGTYIECGEHIIDSTWFTGCKKSDKL